MISEALRAAASDYRWLLDRGYPTPGSLKLVGDRFRLSREERQMLFRGVDAYDAAEARRRRLVDAPAVDGMRLGVDAHNVLLTIANYLRGVPVFEANDGLLRDIGSVHGNVHNDEIISRAIELTGSFLITLVPSSVDLCFDAPVSHSRDHARRLTEVLGAAGVSVQLYLVPSADAALRDRSPDVLATSDSVLINAVASPVFDLARYCLREAYDARFPSFGTDAMAGPPRRA